MAPKRRLNRSSFKGESSSKRLKIEEPSSMQGEELLPVDENGQRMKSYSWLSNYKEMERQSDKLCWAYAIIDWLNHLYFMMHGVRIELSLQEPVHNVRPIGETRSFGYPFDFWEALKWIECNGISLAKDYPYTGVVQRARRKKSGATIIRIKGIERTEPTEEGILKKLTKNPILAVLKYDGITYYKLSLEKKFGVYRLKKNDYPRRDPYSSFLFHLNHGVTLTGWGTDDNGSNYYEVRDPNEIGAPNMGHYGACRPSSEEEDEIGTILYVLNATLGD